MFSMPLLGDMYIHTQNFKQNKKLSEQGQVSYICANT